MLEIVIILGLSLALFFFAVLPLFTRRVDPLADERDPYELDLEEERDALYRAIHEIDAREDLSQERRDNLRARYEAKAARVLRALDEYQLAKSSKPLGPKRAFRIPATALFLVGVMVLSGALLGNYLLPRVGSDASVTTADPLRIERGRELQRLQRLVRENPSGENLLALADAYWFTENFEEARETYRRIETSINPVPNVAYRRLAFFALHEGNIETGLDYLELAREADPQEPETLYALGDVYYVMGRSEEALHVWERYLETPGAVRDEALESRISRARVLAPLQEKVEEAPDEENLLALADAYWELEARDQAADIYLQVIRNLNPRQPQAVKRLGIFLFFSGRNEEAIQMLEIARVLDPENPEGLLFLGNAYFSEERLEEAIEVWERYVEVAGGPEHAGRVPGLIENARQQLGAATPEAMPVTGEQIFAATCASCHGAAGGGGVGPRLAGNPRAADADFVRQIVSRGRGMMPGFQLSESELEAVTRYVVETIQP